MFNTQEKERLKWACRRGMLELDLFLVPFFEKMVDTLSVEEENHFVALLKKDDPILLSWLMAEKEVEEPAFAHLIAKIRQYRLSRTFGEIL